MATLGELRREAQRLRNVDNARKEQDRIQMQRTKLEREIKKRKFDQRFGGAIRRAKSIGKATQSASKSISKFARKQQRRQAPSKQKRRTNNMFDFDF